MSDTATTIPSPSQSIAAMLSGNPDVAPLIVTAPVAEAETAAPAEVAEIIKDAPKEQAPPKAGMADEALSDGIEPEPVKEVAAAEEQREGEKPAQFIKRIKQELADARAQLKQAQEKTSKQPEATPAEIAALRKELAERDAVLEETAYERSRAFQEKFAKPLEKAETSAKEFIGKATESKGVFERALAMDANERAEYLETELGPVKAATAMMKLDAIDGLRQSKAETLANREEISRSLASERQNGETAQILQQFESQRESLAKRLSPLRGEGADAIWEQARSLITGDADQQTILAAAPLAVLCPHYINLCKTQQAEIATLKARIAEDGGDRAKIQGRGADKSDASSGFFRDGKPMSMAEVLKKQGAG
jgi:hypothetical protein